jgi:copper chaperone CopZ
MPAVLMVVALASSACAEEDPSSDYDPNAGLVSCAEHMCANEVNAIRKEVAALPGVARVLSIRYHPKQITDGPSVGGEILLTEGKTATDCKDLEEPLGRLAWQSEVAPLNGIELTCRLRDATEGTYVSATWVLDATAYRDKWGPRSTH